jgi:hypothetical protein
VATYLDFSWPPAGTVVATYQELLVAAVNHFGGSATNPGRSNEPRTKLGADPLLRQGWRVGVYPGPCM